MNKASIKKLLERIPIFKDLTSFELDPIVDLAQQRIFNQGSHIFMQGDPLTIVYFIHKGEIKIYRTDRHGKEQIVNDLLPGDMFPHQVFSKRA